MLLLAGSTGNGQMTHARRPADLRCTRDLLHWLRRQRRYRPAVTRLARWAPALLVLGLIALVARHGIAAVMQVEWIFDHDFYRDIGYAQSLLEGGFGEDPTFLGE